MTQHKTHSKNSSEQKLQTQLELQLEAGTSQPPYRAADTLNGESIDTAVNYKLIRSKRRTMSIGVDRAEVIVRAPLRTPLVWINAFVTEKQRWIQKQISEQSRQLKQLVRINHGASISLLDQALTIHIEKAPSKRSHIVKRDQQLVISLSHCDEGTLPKSAHIEHRATQLFLRWLKSAASGYMTAATNQMAITHNLADKLGKIGYRRTQSKWGHCTACGDIQYNPLVVLAPLYVVDYIIAHELAHLRHHNHSRSFWRLVERIYPSWKEAEQWLKEEGFKLAIK